MSKAGKLVKGMLKAKKESVMGKLGDAPYEDPMEPWSSKYSAPVKNEEVELEEGAFSSGALKPSQKALDAISKTPSSGTVRGKDDKGVYTSKTVNGKEVSRSYEKSVKEDVEQSIDEATMTGIEIKKSKGKLDSDTISKHDVHYNGKKIGHVEAYQHRSGVKYGWTHHASGDAETGDRSMTHAIAGLRSAHAEHLKNQKDSSKEATKSLIKLAKMKEDVEQIDELSDKTLTSYAQKVHDDSMKHDKDPSKRSAEKRNKSVMGFSRAVNKLEARPQKEEVETLEEDSWLFSYIKSLGYNPKIMNFAQRSKYARSNAFKHWKQSHMERRPGQTAAMEETNVEETWNAASGKHPMAFKSAYDKGKQWDEGPDKHAVHINGKKWKTFDSQSHAQNVAKKIKGATVHKEEVEILDEAGTGLLMTYIKAKGLNPLTMDGNQKQAYSRSSEFKVFKQKHAKVRKEEFERLVNTYGADNLAEIVMQIQETSGMGERGDDWNENYTGNPAKEGQVAAGGGTPADKGKLAAKYEKKKQVKEEADKADTVTMDIPLLIRVLEYAREDAKTDMDLHKVVENLIKMRDGGTLSMAEYDEIVSIKEAVEAKYGKDYQDMVKRVGQKAAQKPVDMKSLAARMQASYAKDKKPLKELKRMPDNMDYDDHITREETTNEDLRKWFSKTDPEGGWKRINSKGEAIGPCAREPGEPKPKCMSNEKRAKLSKSERAAAVAAKRRNDPVADRSGKGGKPVNVSNFGKGKLSEEQLDEKNSPTNPKLWSRAKSMARSKFDVYPSAYANGWASKWYKSKGGGWKSVKEDVVQEGIGNAEDSPMSATNSVKAMESAHRSKQMKSARMIKSLYKNKIKETTYDWEKDDKPNAKIVVKGGTTMTGQPRDTVEIEPVLKTRPNQTKPTV